MAKGIVYPNGEAEVVVSDKIAIFSEGSAQVYYKYDLTNLAPTYEYSSTVTNQEVVLTPGASVGTVKISAGNEKVYYETGASPVIDLNAPDFVASSDPLIISGKEASSTAGSDGGDTSLIGADATDGESTTDGGAGGDVSITSGAGGAKTGTGSADGGASGAISITSGDGGDTAATSGGTGGAASSVSLTAGNGGEATAGTSDGGRGGSVILTAGTGGASAGGTAGVSGVVAVASVFVSSLSESTIADSGTVTVAQVRGGIITQDASGGSVTMTSPTGALLDAEFPDLVAGSALTLFVYGNHGSNTSTISGGSGVTLKGSGAVTNTGGTFKLVKTGTAAYDLIRVG